MKSLFAIIVVCVATLAFTKPIEAFSASMERSEKIAFYDIDEYNGYRQAVICATHINFSTATIKISYQDPTQTYEKHSKYKLQVKENLWIEHIVADYLFYIESLTSYDSNLSTLRRLNI